jgi:uracil-DNA glycosylase family 4
LTDVFITAAVKCAPPDNKPTVEERNRCEPYLVREFEALPRLRAIVCLGKFGWDQVVRTLRRSGSVIPSPLPRFGHAVAVPLERGPTLIGSYHPSQQNTFTGRLTEAMLDDVFAIAARAVAV